MARRQDQDGPIDQTDDPAEELRQRILGQQGGNVTDAINDPIPDTGVPTPPAISDNTGINGGSPDTGVVQATPDPQINTPAMPPTGTTNPTVYDNPAPGATTIPTIPAPPTGGGYTGIQGFDYAKLSNPNYVDAKYSAALRTFSQGLASGVQLSRGNLGGMVTYAQQHGNPTAQAVGDDKIDFGDGQGPIDVIQSNGSIWFQNGADRLGGGISATPTPGVSGTQAIGATTGGAATATGNVFGQQAPGGLWSPEFLAQLRQIIMQRLGDASKPVDPNDPSIALPMSAARDQATRSTDTERNALAERAYATGGLNTDVVSRQIQQSGEKNAGALSSLRATLITKELQSRKDELTNILQLAIQSGDADSARQVQMQIAALNAEIQREGIGATLGMYQQTQNTQANNSVI